MLCQKSGLGIFITFFNGKADAIAYRKIAGNVLRKGEKIPDNEVELLLKSNTDDNPWKKRAVISMDREWETETGELLATYVTFEPWNRLDWRAREEKNPANISNIFSSGQSIAIWTPRSYYHTKESIPSKQIDGRIQHEIAKMRSS